MLYQFSIPMPYIKENVDTFIQINNEVEKSQITSLYFSLPSSNELFTGFEQRRNMMLNETKFDFWKSLACYGLEKGFDMIYCLNSPRPLPIENPNFPKQIERLHKLLDELNKIGINKLRIAPPKLMSYIHKYFPQFELYGSTASDYKLIQEFYNFKLINPYVKEIVPSHNVNKNFRLLKNIQKLGIDVEIMVNEGCIQGCSNRFEHENTLIDGNYEHHENNEILSESYCKLNCKKIENKDPFLYLAKGNHIYPWEIEEYGKIGITKFKLNGRDGLQSANSETNFSEMTRLYLKGIDNIKYIQDFPVICYAWNSTNREHLQNLKVKDIKHFLPKIKHFIKKGEYCSSVCGEECKYCFKCAEKIEKIYNKLQEKERKQTVPICIKPKAAI